MDQMWFTVQCGEKDGLGKKKNILKVLLQIDRSLDAGESEKLGEWSGALPVDR